MISWFAQSLPALPFRLFGVKILRLLTVNTRPI